MEYIIFAAAAVVSAVLIVIFGARKGVIDTGAKLKLYKPCDDEDISPFKGKILIMMTIVCIGLAFGIQISLYMNTSVINIVKLYGLFLIVLSAAVVDFKRKIIPNILILIGLVFRIGMYVWEYFSGLDVKSVLINDLIGLAIGFGLLALVSILSKGALGFGDAKLFGIIGLCSGAFCTYSTLLLSLIISVVVSVVSIARKKMTRKDSFPFGPCIAIGYIVAVFFTSY